MKPYDNAGAWLGDSVSDCHCVGDMIVAQTSLQAAENGFAAGRFGLEDRIEQLERENKALREALITARHWFESERKSISKGNGSQWSIWQCEEQMEIIDAALSADKGEKP